MTKFEVTIKDVYGDFETLVIVASSIEAAEDETARLRPNSTILDIEES